MMPRDKTARLDDDDDDDDDDGGSKARQGRWSEPSVVPRSRGCSTLFRTFPHTAYTWSRRDGGSGMFDVLAVGSRVHGSQGM